MMRLLEEDFGVHRRASLLIIIVGLLIYSNSIHCTFHFDDYGYIVFNKGLRNLGDIPLVFQGFGNIVPSRGLPAASFSINYYLGGLAVEGYHWFNLSLHLLNGIIVYFLTGLLLRYSLGKAQGKSFSFEEGTINVLALFTALFFVASPVQTHAVTYIVQRTEEMAAFFYLLSLLLFIKAVSGGGVWSYLASLFSFLCAIWSKETAYTAPAILFLYYWFFTGKERSRCLKLMLPYLGIAGVSFYLGVLPWARRFGFHAPWDWNWWEYFLTQANVMVDYIKLLVLPLPSRLKVDVDYPLASTLWGWPTLFSLATLAFLLGASVFLFKRKRPLEAFGILWFFVTLFPTSSFIPLGEIMVLYRLYLPGFAFYLLLVIGIHQGLQYLRARRGREGKRVSMVEILIFTSILLGYCIGTYKSNKVWENDVTLWEDAVKKSPEKVRPHYCLGVSYYLVGYYNKGRTQYVLRSKGLEGFQDKAKTELLKAIEIYERSPHQGDERIVKMYGLAFALLGDIYRSRGEHAEAIRAYKKSLGVDFGRADVHNNLGVSYYSAGGLEEAEKEFKLALEIEPLHPDARQNLDRLYKEKGMQEEAPMVNPEGTGADVKHEGFGERGGP